MDAEIISCAGLISIIGALIGVVSVTMAEYFYTKAAADEIIDHHERKYLRHISHGLTYGMTLVLLSDIALIVFEYLLPDSLPNLYAAPFWMLQSLTLFVLLMALLLSRKQIPWWFASATIFTGWWMILFIDLGFMNSYSYIVLLVQYIAGTIIIAGILQGMRALMRTK